MPTSRTILHPGTLRGDAAFLSFPSIPTDSPVHGELIKTCGELESGQFEPETGWMKNSGKWEASIVDNPGNIHLAV